MDNRIYVSVDVSFDIYGQMLPQNIVWEDGSVYTIDKVTDIRQSHAAKSGGQGDRYTVMIGGREKFLFFERSPAKNGNLIGSWFVERR